jgi:hypothetical protein
MTEVTDPPADPPDAHGHWPGPACVNERQYLGEWKRPPARPTAAALSDYQKPGWATAFQDEEPTSDSRHTGAEPRGRESG